MGLFDVRNDERSGEMTIGCSRQIQHRILRVDKDPIRAFCQPISVRRRCRCVYFLEAVNPNVSLLSECAFIANNIGTYFLTSSVTFPTSSPVPAINAYTSPSTPLAAVTACNVESFIFPFLCSIYTKDEAFRDADGMNRVMR